MDDVDDLLNGSQPMEEEEEDEELDEDLVDAARERNREDQEEERDRDDEQDGGNGDEDLDEDIDVEMDENDNDKDENPNVEENDDASNRDDSMSADEAEAEAEGQDESVSPEEKPHYQQAPGSMSAASSGYDKIYQYYSQLYHNAKIGDFYSINPTAAIPIQTHVHSLAMSKGLKFLFLGGEDGYVRKYDFLNTIEGKLSLTILQKHSLVDSISNAGILQSYWENEVPQKRADLKLTKTGKEYEPVVSPVHALDVQSECMFLLSGLENGGITMQGCRFFEGQISHYFKRHTDIVNQLRLSSDETKFISGGWDKQILEWDISSGQVINEFKGATSQISSLELRPLHSTVNMVDVKKNSEDSENNDRKDDDDLDSLFGDDNEDEIQKRLKAEKASDQGELRKAAEKSGEKETNTYNEISRTTLKKVEDENTFLSSCTNGSVHVWDRRISTKPVVHLNRGTHVPPWCMSACWSADGNEIFVGRRNACVEKYDLRAGNSTSLVMKFPNISGPVSCVRSMPNNKHVLCASNDNIRLYDVSPSAASSKTPFLIVPGHHGGIISNLYVDPTCRFLISTSGSRGWQGVSTDTALIYDINVEGHQNPEQ
ncbi:LAMI_0G16688g1_1 [Lachancea mirantina]|uniref:LAMI_0G16688g1_1 n=1 Tax=Lachancea mirantina TaxID=1230905 RepID=A0A1G4KCQ3_9SACH|nr:LAMI_0G16688g1_1 [Lachancea mirantina]